MLRLNNSSPFVILGSTSLRLTIGTTMTKHCRGAKRIYTTTGHFVVRRKVTSTFARHFITTTTTLGVNSPHSRRGTLKPVTHFSLHSRLRRRIRGALTRNTHLLLNKRGVTKTNGCCPPAILTGIAPRVATFQRRVFNPITTVAITGSTRRTLRLTGSDRFNLSTAVFAASRARTERVTTHLRYNKIFVGNCYTDSTQITFNNIGGDNFNHRLSRFNLRRFYGVRAI